MQQRYSLSDTGIEEDLIKVRTMRRFIGLELIIECIPDDNSALLAPLGETQTGQADLGYSLCSSQWPRNELLQSTTVEAILIVAPNSIKNKEGTQDTEMQ